MNYGRVQLTVAPLRTSLSLLPELRATPSSLTRAQEETMRACLSVVVAVAIGVCRPPSARAQVQAQPAGATLVLANGVVYLDERSVAPSMAPFLLPDVVVLAHGAGPRGGRAQARGLALSGRRLLRARARQRRLQLQSTRSACRVRRLSRPRPARRSSTAKARSGFRAPDCSGSMLNPKMRGASARAGCACTKGQRQCRW